MANGANMVPFKEIVGRDAMSMVALVKQINDASWPSEVVLDPRDFFALALGQEVKRENDETFFYVCATKVRCKKPRYDLLNLTAWEPPAEGRIIIPDGPLPGVGA